MSIRVGINGFGRMGRLALRAAWGARTAEERGLVGRPRREVGAPPVDAERIAWGEARLTGAVLAWAEGR